MLTKCLFHKQMPIPRFDHNIEMQFLCCGFDGIAMRIRICIQMSLQMLFNNKPHALLVNKPYVLMQSIIL